MANKGISLHITGKRHLLKAGLVLMLLLPVAVQAAPASDTPRASPDKAELLEQNLDANVPLHARVAPPTAEALAAFSQMAGKTALAHQLDAAEQKQLEQAFSSLPALHQEILKRHLRHLSFVDADGSGSGLTAVVGDGEYPLFDITLRAGILDETLSEFLTKKERQVFSNDGSGTVVSVTAPGDALTYVVLHEATHVVDHVFKISSNLATEFNDGIWLDRRGLNARLNAQVIADTRYRGGEPVPAVQAVELYKSLADTSFVSLYATAAAPEDFAELVTWRELSLRSPGDLLQFIVRNGEGEELYALRPLEGAAVRRRMEAITKLLAEFDTGHPVQLRAQEEVSM